MPRSFLTFYFLLFTFFSSTAQKENAHLRVSLLTCQPGEDLYSTFGHSALRITDSISGDDIVYNYGTFDFNEPGFYLKFIRGKLLYYLSTADYDSFTNEYKQENRGITEQVLDLTSSEKNKIKNLLWKNLESGNRYYKYDFLFDNCTTRLRDLVENTADSNVVYHSVLTKPTRFRELIYVYLDNGDEQWSKLGIDLLLGMRTDAIMDTRQVMFLPDFLMKTLGKTVIGKTPAVNFTHQLFSVAPQNTGSSLVTDPGFIFSALFLIIICLSLVKKPWAQKFVSNFDGLLFFIAGLLGILILIMWFGTDHKMCSDNFNILWALPIHAIAAFKVKSRQPFWLMYFKVNAGILALLLITWHFLPQHMNTAFLPVVMLLLYRSLVIGFRTK